MVAPLDIDRVEIRGAPVVLVSDAEVDEMQDRLGIELPDGYRDYVTRLGEGRLNVFVRVHPPWRIMAELDEHRGTMSAYWFWESGKVPFGQEEAMESIQIADTMDGDVIVFHPSDHKRIIVLPRHGDRLYVRGPDLLETINWVCSGGAIRRFGPLRYFEPFDSRLDSDRTPRATSAPKDPGVPVAFATPSTTSWDASSKERPELDQPPRDVLLAYFAELRAVEEWALSKAGGPQAFRGDSPPELSIDFEELMRRSSEVHARYCTPRLANALYGASVSVSGTPEHDPAAFRILEENEERSGRVVIRTGKDSDPVVVHQYVLEQSGREWRISSQTDLGIEDPTSISG